MKVSALAIAVAAALALDAKQTGAVKNAIDLALAADRKARDEGGLGPVEIQNKGAKDAAEKEEAAKDAAAEYFGHTKDEWEKMPAKDKAAARDKARDSNDDPEKTNDEEIEAEDDIQPAKTATGNSGAGGKEPAKDKAKDKAAQDAAIKLALDARDALHAARREVEPVLGVVTYDSAPEVYKAACAKLGVAIDGVHPTAYATIFRLARDKVVAQTPVIASDAAVVTTMAGLIKGYKRLP